MMEELVIIGKLLLATLLYLMAIQLCMKLRNYIRQKKKERKQNGIT